MEEEFVDIPGFENYEINRSGIIKDLKTGKILKCSISMGYLRVSLKKEKTSYMVVV